MAATSNAAPRGYDVVVVGNTPAAVSAAVAAGRRGMHVALVSRDVVLGGELVRAMVTQWDVQDAPHGASVLSGLFRTFYAELPSGFDPEFAAGYFRRTIDGQRDVDWIAGVRGLRAFGRQTETGRILSSITFGTRSGKTVRLTAPCFIDATNDGDLAASAGAAYDVGRQDQGRDMRMQPVTLLFELAGVDWNRVRSSYDPQRFGPGSSHSSDAFGYSLLVRRYRPVSRYAMVPDINFQLQRDGMVVVNAIDILGIDGRKPAELTRARAIAEVETKHFVLFLRSQLPGFEHAHIARFAPEPYVRETRHIRGLATITAYSIWHGARPYDTVALAAYPIDVHPITRDEHGGDGWAEEPRLYGVPLRALVVDGLHNLAIVGPAVSATHTASGSVRVEPTTISEGEAAGGACAFSVRHRQDLVRIATSRPLMRALQRDLEAHGLTTAQPAN